MFFPGADDVIAFNSDDKIYELEERDLLLKELTIREHFDVVFLTTAQTYNRDFVSKFVCRDGIIVDTVEKRLASDEYGFFMRFLCSVSAVTSLFGYFDILPFLYFDTPNRSLHAVMYILPFQTFSMFFATDLCKTGKMRIIRDENGA